MKKFGFLVCLGLIVMLSCKEEPKDTFAINPADYNTYLATTHNESYQEAIAQKEFWSKRMRPDSTGVGDLAPLAGAYELLFETTGKADHLYAAEKLYRKGMEVSANDKDAFARGLAHNLISQHRFKEAYAVLKETLEGPSNKHQTRLMLFDAAMEVGDYDGAYAYLNSVKNLSDYNYLIRLSKWSDYRGDLDNAIKFMEDAKAVAESRDSKPLKIWTYSNLGDYYGHAGRIKDAYEHYVKTLELQPDNAYVKKGLAWIAYSHAKDTQEAHRILDSIMIGHAIPDYHLFKSELYAYENDETNAEQYENQFLSEIEKGNYGDMYNAYRIELWADSQPDKALDLAKKEVENRPTPEAYHLLALAKLRNGDTQGALQTIESRVENKTYEPMAAYHSALVYKANAKSDEMKDLKAELLEAEFELGPELIKKIEDL
ncbi:tetratricopeptide repeat protein [Aureisphaera galaxeae]|uniref:tetratricopeptide repeat protein n=1 Tax=Aureisphaera galaxeae TaxID=1538023 RepID=UPI0023509212|nr:tetratricopeptide repeat protein [Aureisphaera galaxeae]MDC8003566.1 tetratricopeptide repeat protein [Aureisphaera galaxeae]